jgi:hypothetical protein
MDNDEGAHDGTVVQRHEARTRGDADTNALLARLAICMVEMEQGLRPVSTLDELASPMAARRIRKVVHLAATGRRTGARRTAPASVLRTMSFHPSAGVTEGVVVLQCDSRARAFSVRLEQEGDRWWIVELAPPESGLSATVTLASRNGAIPTGPDGRRWSSGRPAEPSLLRPRDGGPTPRTAEAAKAAEGEAGDPDAEARGT